MTLWIIIGSLVGLVAIFLVVMSIKDRKKAKIQKEKDEELNEKRQSAGNYIVLYLSEVINANEKILKEFVPSVGKLKMGDIKDKAKHSIESLKKSSTFKLAKEAEENEKLIETVELFEKTNSNTWTRKLEKEIKRIKKQLGEIDKDYITTTKVNIKEELKGIYK